MPAQAATVEQYLKGLPSDRREAVEAIRRAILDNLDKGFQETIQYGMIGYSVPHSIFPDGYHCDPKQPLPFAGIGNQKNHIGLYLCCIYMDPEMSRWFQAEWKKTGKRLDMGKACVRVKKIDDIPLDVIGRTIKKIKLKKFVAGYEAAMKSMSRNRK